MTADPEVVNSILAWPHTFLEIDHGLLSVVILLCLLIQEELLSVTSKIIYTEYWLTTQSELSQGKCG